MKGLFQCPPRATPWVFMDATLRPVRAKALKPFPVFVSCCKGTASPVFCQDFRQPERWIV